MEITAEQYQKLIKSAPTKKGRICISEAIPEYKEKVIEPILNSRKKPHQLEHILQVNCVNWFRVTYPDLIIIASANGGSRNKIEATKLKRSGVLSGASDLHIPISNKSYHSLFIELKVGKNKQQDSQKEFQRIVTKFGNKYELCYTFEQFKIIIKEYLKNI